MSAAPKPHPDAKEPRETGTSGNSSAGRKAPVDTPSVPDPQTKKRPLTPDEKVDEAALESMDASDPPAFQPSTTGASPDRKSEKKQTGKSEAER